MTDTNESWIEIKPQALPPSTLTELVKAFILREGTDYGAVEISLETKIQQVKKQIESNELMICFDLTTETCTLVTKK